MATIVCQGLQSCDSCLQESQLVEPRTLRLKLFSATPVELGFKSFLPSESIQIKELTHEEKCHNEKPATKNSDSGGWSFLQSLSNGSSSSSSLQKNPPPTTVYNKRSWSATRLSDKSLELCTENLGNETGTIFVENNIFEANKCVAERDQQPKKSRSLGIKKSRSVHNFPPPLTTISSGSESLQVKPHREDGRLILKAVKAPLTTHTFFQAERSNGRLRLCFSKDLFFAPTFDSELQTAATEEDIEADIVEDDENERDDEQEEQGEEDNGKIALGEKEDLVSLIDEMQGNNDFKVGDETEGMDKFERPSRCKEGGEHEKKGLLNFKTFNWVAT